MNKILIVGAGFSGAVIARELADNGFSITLIDKRDHIGGNSFDFVNEYGIRVHRYGPHIFHTSNLQVVNWLSRFTKWVQYKHKVKALLFNGEYVTLPVNLETIKIVGKDNILNVLFRPYTKKMWGVDLDDLDPSIINRIPIRDDLNEYYFPNDNFQALPAEGYTYLFNNILDHANINVSLNTSFEHSMISSYDHIFNSMPIDEFFNFQLGELPYRSIKFHTHSIPIPRILPVATVNFTHHEKFTRVTEWKNFPSHGNSSSFTTITIEEPCDYKDNFRERYYPVKDISGLNLSIYNAYKKLIPANVTFIGRCGLYAYLDMHQAISSALSISNKFLNKAIGHNIE